MLFAAALVRCADLRWLPTYALLLASLPRINRERQALLFFFFFSSSLLLLWERTPKSRNSRPTGHSHPELLLIPPGIHRFIDSPIPISDRQRDFQHHIASSHLPALPLLRYIATPPDYLEPRFWPRTQLCTAIDSLLIADREKRVTLGRVLSHYRHAELHW
ncbi:uncharacterized protein LY79DRAFT_76068 [Colletotrichum navitas]|uniref:Uncharacterized protein n=1 Tax=Colletotrichum navitas TaxID=681940 RepID=A0AAD8Q5K9_9PEZI|nr:uncharacterized protein LY79DRAFT_76068 [Colletotrichum navitas]KAK1596034.1 hypothetical protein LY79DRAFT_76068 [Colletotrichum navitas]